MTNNKAEVSQYKRVLGSLVGFAIGDAMGATTEFMTKEQIQARYRKVTSIVGGGWLGLKAGQVTDDTQMMLCVYRGIKAGNGDKNATLTSICSEFKTWAEGGPADIGNTCAEAILEPKTCSPMEWLTCNKERVRRTNRRPLGNGGLMRCLVPCLMGDLEMAEAQCLLTHYDDTQKVYIECYFETLQEALNGQLQTALLSKFEPLGLVATTYTNAEYWYKSSKTLRDAIIGAVNDGGDADTIAALTGGLAGAFYGFDAIPKEWVGALDNSTLLELKECADYIVKHYA